jgi:hypothetical protein
MRETIEAVLSLPSEFVTVAELAADRDGRR